MTLPNRPDPDIAEIDRNNVWHHMTQHKAFETKDPLVIVEGKGMILTDANGREYLDATSGGVWSVNVGYGRESIAKAVSDQLIKMCYFSGSGGTVPGAIFAKKLLEKMPGLSRVYYSNSGSEANEKGYKMVRQLAHIEGGGTKHKVIFRNRDYHGTTIGALSLEEGPETIGSVVLEPMTAGGGIIIPVPEYFPIIQDICKKYDVLLHIDEVVCGFGRTGEWFGYQHFDVKPDIVTMAKGTASGYAALSCTVTTEDLFDRFKANPDDNMSYFRDISTFGGCAGGHSAAVESMRIIEDEKLLENTRQVGAYFMDALHGLKDKHSIIGDVRGKGFFGGLELVKDRETLEPVDESYVIQIAGNCMKDGLMIGRTNRSFARLNNSILLTPALIAGKSEIDEIIQKLDNALTKTAKANA